MATIFVEDFKRSRASTRVMFQKGTTIFLTWFVQLSVKLLELVHTVTATATEKWVVFILRRQRKT